MVENFINRNKVPVSPVSVDKKSIRSVIRKGNNFSITGVPTIVIVYSDDEIEKYEGKKVLQFLDMLVNSGREQREPSYRSEEPSYEGEENPSYGEVSMGGEEEENDFLEPPEEGTSPQKKANVKEQKMKTIKDIAKQMEEERKRAYGYNEDELPKGY